MYIMCFPIRSFLFLSVQISPVAEVQAPVKDSGCDKEGGLTTKDVAAANATEVGMGTPDPVSCFFHRICWSARKRKFIAAVLYSLQRILL